MNVFVFAIICIFITNIYANFTVVDQYPNGTISINIQDFNIKIDREVNSPNFQSYIHIYENPEKLVCKIDASIKDDKVITYTGKILKFQTSSDSCKWNNNTSEYHIKLDEGVLYSNVSENSTAKNESTFWTWKYVPDNQTTTTTTTTASSTATSSSSSSSGETTPTKATASLPTFLRGESPPTRSAQLGMGLSITLIGILIIGEIIYFKRFYHGNSRSGNYLA